MKVQLKSVTAAGLVEGYHDDREGGVRGYGGKLDIRPPYQREFIYGDKQRKAVIDSILKGFPLNVMYWADREDGTFEVIDGQQRTISIAQYLTGQFTVNDLFIENQPSDVVERILAYPLMVYACTGTDSEKLKWFETINIAGEKLTKQELRNAVYSGPWVSDAKRYFSRTGGPAYGVGQDYLKGTAIRQDYLETAIKWISGGEIEDYMARHQHDADAKTLWAHFRNVIDWVESLFASRPRLMRGVDWGSLYDDHKDAEFDREWVEDETRRLIADDDVERQKGIYAYLLDGDERHLRIRAFSPTMKRRAYEAQGGKCAACGDEFTLAQMEADHITPWRDKGGTVQENCQVLCRECNRRKGAK
ncbi:DUF262 domain-containing protein [Candidatus Poribacteria bacterium]|nr:DUF262 domain-containing protein [Candidatus Poribacteria bacterium]